MAIKINLIEYLSDTVQKNAEKIAVYETERSITFYELDQRARVLGTYLIHLNLIKKPIAVFLPKSIESVLSNIAITYSGNFYMNLEVRNPIERIQNICKQIKPALVITSSQWIPLIQDIQDIQLLNLDDFDFKGSADDGLLKSVQNSLIDVDPYCIINTSGSTGTPKGVVLNHRSFIDFLERSFESFDINEYEVIGSLSPIVFDIYSIELCFLMAKSASIILIPSQFSAFPVRILELLEKYQATFLFWVPTIMVNIANMDLLSTFQLRSLKLVWFAGEVFPTSKFNYWKKHLSQVMFANLYGPIEITLDCTYYIVDKEISDNQPIPIGKAYKNTEILILNEYNKIADLGEEGELCVRGTSLAMGYYNDLEKTKEVFVQNPLNTSYPELIYRTGDIVFVNQDGDIVFKGRKDNVIKHQGYRIELDEIEHIFVNTLKIVKNGCAVYNKQKKEITFFYEYDKEVDPRFFYRAVDRIIPKYMIPTKYIKMDELPRNDNGKINRIELMKQIS